MKKYIFICTAALIFGILIGSGCTPAKTSSAEVKANQEVLDRKSNVNKNDGLEFRGKQDIQNGHIDIYKDSNIGLASSVHIYVVYNHKDEVIGISVAGRNTNN